MKSCGESLVSKRCSHASGPIYKYAASFRTVCMSSNRSLVAKVASTVRILGKTHIGRGSQIHDFVTIYPRVRIGLDTEVFENAVLGRPPRGTRALARAVSPKILPTSIGDFCVISPHATIFTDVRIGDGTLIGDGASVRERARIGKDCIVGHCAAVSYNVRIGNGTKIMDGTYISGNSTVGSGVFIGMLVSTSNDNHMGTEGYSEKVVQGPTIEDDVRIGQGSCILPRIRVGQGSIIGAGAVVTKDVPPYSLAMGMPARVVRSLKEGSKSARKDRYSVPVPPNHACKVGGP
jgi:acetyltransferase-like isoleucine patch superfamily enzyme